MRRTAGVVGAVAAGVLVAASLGGCTESSPAPSPAPTTGVTVVSPEPTAAAPTTPAAPVPSPTGTLAAGGDVTARAQVVAQDLPVPWGIAPLPTGTLLVSLRDERRLLVVDPSNGGTRRITGPGADALAADTVASGEGGLLGVAVSPTFVADHRVFVYRTGRDANQVLRGELSGDRLGLLTVIVDGIPHAAIHNGGRLAFGPDGYLYITTGDASQGAEAAQSLGSLGGKILRVTPDGDPAPGNPFPGSPVWTLGHRNVQGVGWDATGRMFASEFGQNTWDELNEIVAGSNYGWPVVEGKESEHTGTDPSNPPEHYRDPLQTWHTSEASPSGLAVTGDAVYLAALRGQSLWRVPFADVVTAPDGTVTSGFGRPQRLLQGEYGRLRAVVPVPGSDDLYVLTNNTDGRGTPYPADDKLLRVTLTAAS